MVNADCVTGKVYDKEDLNEMIHKLMKLKKELKLHHMDVRIHQMV